MKAKVFKQLIKDIIEIDEFYDKLGNILNTQIFDITPQVKAFDLFKLAILNEYDEVGFDWVDWFIYEKLPYENSGRGELKAFDENKNEIIRNVDELYQYLEKHHKR